MSWVAPGPNVEFYMGRRPSEAPHGKTGFLDEILGWSDQVLEEEHFFIQWLFPMRGSVGVNPMAHPLSDRELEHFRSNPELQLQVLRAYQRMLRFYGWGWSDRKLERLPNYMKRQQNLSLNRHNFARLTRIISSLGDMGLATWALLLVQELLAPGNCNRFPEASRQAWRQAILPHLPKGSQAILPE